MPRKQINITANEKLKRTRLAFEQLKLEQARHDWKKTITPRLPGMAKHDFYKQAIYKQMVQKLDNIRYRTMLYELSELTAQKEKEMVEGEIAALRVAEQTHVWIENHKPDDSLETRLIPDLAIGRGIGDIDNIKGKV
ncbi:MAG: hypothetical protein JKY25_10460 [Robiginitomaculum sp.]|nr:hypothetical protein [Robiginitomaculum sp.]